MAWVRGQERFVYQRVFTVVRDHMMGPFGWDGVLLGRLPYDAKEPLTIRDIAPELKTNEDRIVPNAIGFSEGPMPDDDDIEMGGGLQQTDHTIFVDIYAESLSVAKVLAVDVRSILTGRAVGTNRYMTLPNYGGPDPSAILPGHLIEMQDVMVSFPDGANQRNWAVVKATAVHTWNP